MARLKYDGLTGTLGAAHNDSTTTLTLTSKLTYVDGDVPTIASPDYLPLSILDADGKCAEIVHVTAYTSAATTATITRAAEPSGATAAAHDSGATFVNGPTARETGEWLSYTPTLTATVTNPTLGTGSVVSGRYKLIGDICFAFVSIRFGTSGVAAGTGSYLISLPVDRRTSTSFENHIVGVGYVYDNSPGTIYNTLLSRYGGDTQAQMQLNSTGAIVTHSAPFAWSTQDIIIAQMMYEANVG